MESEMEKVNSLMAQAQNRMGQVEDREATPEEEEYVCNGFTYVDNRR
ncbi:MAG: hypothetical protein ACLVGL_09445 [Waltera sp.]